MGRETGRPLLGRHYVFAQVQNNPGQGRRIWQARYAHNVGDGSGQASGYFEWTLFSRVAPFALVSVTHGALRSEFGAQRDRMVMAGARIFVW